MLKIGDKIKLSSSYYCDCSNCLYAKTIGGTLLGLDEDTGQITLENGQHDRFPVKYLVKIAVKKRNLPDWF